MTGISTSDDLSQTNNYGANFLPGASCTITGSFVPTAAGATTGTVTANDNSATPTQSVSLAGTGVIRRTLIV